MGDRIAHWVGGATVGMAIDPPEGWHLWNEEADRVILAYRPDVFDGGEYPAACLPTVYVTRGQRDRRPGGQRTATDAWFLTLFLEPDVEYDTQRFETRSAAIEDAVALADRFGSGNIDYRGLYQVPRPAYFEALDELTGRE